MVHEAVAVFFFAIRGMRQTSGMGTRAASSRWAQAHRCSKYLLVAHGLRSSLVYENKLSIFWTSASFASSEGSLLLVVQVW